MSGQLDYPDLELLHGVACATRRRTGHIRRPGRAGHGRFCRSDIEILVRSHLRTLSKPKRGEKNHALRACRGRA